MIVELLQQLIIQYYQCHADIKKVNAFIKDNQVILDNFKSSIDKELALENLTKLNAYIKCLHAECLVNKSLPEQAEEIKLFINKYNMALNRAKLYGLGESGEYAAQLFALTLPLNTSVPTNNPTTLTENKLGEITVFLNELQAIHKTPTINATHTCVYQKLLVLFEISGQLLQNYCGIFLHAAKYAQIALDLENNTRREKEKLEDVATNLQNLREIFKMIQERDGDPKTASASILNLMKWTELVLNDSLDKTLQHAVTQHQSQLTLAFTPLGNTHSFVKIGQQRDFFLYKLPQTAQTPQPHRATASAGLTK